MNRFTYDDVVTLEGPDDGFLGRIISWRADRSAYGVMSLDSADVYVLPADQLRLVLQRETLIALADQADPPPYRMGSRRR